MTIPYLLPALLTLHLIALILMAGTTLIDFVSLRTFWKLFAKQKEKAMVLLETTASFSRLIGIGAATLITTGLLMMFATHGVFGEQLWFRIKFILVLVLVANGLFVGRRQGVQLRKVVQADHQTLPEPVMRIRKKLRRFHLSQLVIFAVIIFLSIFKFN
jgi:hypothetical protein